MTSTKLDFDMTPELQEALQREIQQPNHFRIHPSLPPGTKIIDDYLVLYNPAMKLPEPDDEDALLAWLGINEKVSKIVLEGHKERLAEEEFPVLTQAEHPGATLLFNLAVVFYANIDGQRQFDEPKDFDGYVNSAYQIGLKPEFALLCGLHPEKKCAVGEREQWYDIPPLHHVSYLMREYSSMLVQLWKDREEYYRLLEEKKMAEGKNKGVST